MAKNVPKNWPGRIRTSIAWTKTKSPAIRRRANLYDDTENINKFNLSKNATLQLIQRLGL